MLPLLLLRLCRLLLLPLHLHLLRRRRLRLRVLLVIVLRLRLRLNLSRLLGRQRLAAGRVRMRHAAAVRVVRRMRRHGGGVRRRRTPGRDCHRNDRPRPDALGNRHFDAVSRRRGHHHPAAGKECRGDLDLHGDIPPWRGEGLRCVRIAMGVVLLLRVALWLLLLVLGVHHVRGDLAVSLWMHAVMLRNVVLLGAVCVGVRRRHGRRRWRVPRHIHELSDGIELCLLLLPRLLRRRRLRRWSGAARFFLFCIFRFAFVHSVRDWLGRR